MTRIPIVVKVWAGAEAHDFQYVSRSLPSLLRSDLPDGVEILVFDDCSTDPRLQPFLAALAAQDRRVRIFRHDGNKGPNQGQVDAYAVVETEYPDAPYFVNVDDDVVYHRRWLSRLLEARDDLRPRAVTGIFTALNMPFRAPHEIVHTGAHTYLLKWKQPALNWLIPREIYGELGPFTDEGVAYDTPYTHWLRLNGYPVICLTPSLVQNIGTFGAYSRDQSTTSDDFLGEGEGDSRLVMSVRRAWRRAVRPWRRQVPDIAPIRWGSDWVYEKRVGNGKGVALFRAADAVQLGWTEGELEKRVTQIQRVQARGPFAISGFQRDRRGRITGVECAWRCLPNLRESRKYSRRYGVPGPSALLAAIVRDLVPLHEHGVAHNKIRPDNLYIDEGGTDAYLAWYGTEPPQGRNLASDTRWAMGAFGGALDKRARSHLREAFATSYLAAVAPEVIAGQPATLRSDVFSAAALVLLSLGPEPRTLADLETLRSKWLTAVLPPQAGSPGLKALLTQCLAADPSRRLSSAAALRAALSQTV